MAPGMAMLDAPVDGPRGGWLLNHFGGGVGLMAVEADLPQRLPDGVAGLVVAKQARPLPAGATMLVDGEGLVAARYGAGSVYLIRPDQHVAARLVRPDATAIEAALKRATGRA